MRWFAYLLLLGYEACLLVVHFSQFAVVKVRDIARGYSDADIESMQLKLDSGNRKFTDREHTAYVCEVQQDDDE